MATTITYNSTNLNDSNIITSEVFDSNAPERHLPLYRLLRSGGAVITDSNYYEKKISIKGTLLGSSVDNLESRIDSFHALFAVENKNLDLGYNSSTRRYVCTPSYVNVDRPVRAANWAKFEVDFIATEYGKDTGVSTLESANPHTGATEPHSLVIGGSAPQQFLRIAITVTAATGLTSKTIGVENDTTGELIEVTRDWAVSEVLEIDVANKTVEVDGTAVEFNGALAEYTPGTHSMIVTNDFTTRTLTVTVDYIKRYL